MRIGAALAVLLTLPLAACWTRGDTTPTTATGDGSAPPQDDARQYNLSRINALRAQNGAGPLVLDDTFDAFAQAGSDELAQDHRPHAHFSSDVSSCGCDVRAENQGDPNGWTVASIHTQIDQILDAMMSEGPGGGHHDNIVNPQWKRLGVGLVNPGGSLYFTNDFGP
jgi:uncharacterized protein YkwD